MTTKIEGVCWQQGELKPVHKILEAYTNNQHAILQLDKGDTVLVITDGELFSSVKKAGLDNKPLSIEKLYGDTISVYRDTIPTLPYAEITVERINPLITKTN